MNLRTITQDEINERQQFIRTGYRQTKKSFSVGGIRHLIGSSFIAFGEKIYGRCEARREAISMMVPLTSVRGS